jgi:hypothetical protein
MYFLCNLKLIILFNYNIIITNMDKENIQDKLHKLINSNKISNTIPDDKDKDKDKDEEYEKLLTDLLDKFLNSSSFCKSSSTSSH